MPLTSWIHLRLALILRRLLQRDRPVPQRTDAELAAEVARNYRWNFAVNILDNTAFWFGISFISAGTIVPLFISKLTASPLPIGLAAILAQGGWYLPQLFTAQGIERLARKKPVVVNLGFFSERVPMWLLVIAAAVAAGSPLWALLLFFLGYAWFNLGSGVVATAWQDLIARCFPVERRGRFWGIASFVGVGAGFLGSGLSAWILETVAFPTNFVYLFGIAAFWITVSWFFLALTREPVQPVLHGETGNRPLRERLWQLLQRDHNFRRFLVARLLIGLGRMGLGFVTVAAVQRWGVSDSTVGLYTAASLLGQTAGNLAFGLLADRYGHKLTLELGTGGALLGFLLAWLAPTPEWYYIVFFLMGISTGSVIISGILIVMEFCEPEQRPTYMGLANTSVGVVAVAGPLIGAGLAGIDYSWLFGASVLFSLVAIVTLHLWVQEPRWAGTKPSWS